MKNINEILSTIESDFRKHLVSPEESEKTEKILNQLKIRQVERLSKLPEINFNYDLCNRKLLSFIESNYKKNMQIVTISSGKCKTRTMIHAAREYYIAQLKYVYFYTAGELAREIAGSYGEKKTVNIVNHLKNIDLFILDDLGKEKLTDRVSADIFEIIDHRYLLEKPTWIASNYLGNELSKRFGEKGPYLVRRIKEAYQIYSTQ